MKTLIYLIHAVTDCGQLSTSCVLNFSRNYYNQLCQAKVK